MRPVNFEQLQAEGMLFNIVSSEKEITDHAKENFVNEAINTAKVDQITFQHNDLVRPAVNIVYYPLWVVRYTFAGRTYQVVVDGEDGTICYGKAPGNNLYRAVVGIFGLAVGMYLATFFGAFAIAGGNSGAKAAFIIYIFALIFGIVIIRWAYKKFRYGGEVEEGTGIVVQTSTKSASKTTSAVKSIAGNFGAGDVVNIASSFLRR